MISLPLPPSINATYKTGNGRFYKSQEATLWERECRFLLARQYRRKCIDEPVYVGLEFFFKRERDIDGGIKLLLDFLHRNSVIKDDRQVIHLNVKKYFDRDNPRVQITVERVLL